MLIWSYPQLSFIDHWLEAKLGYANLHSESEKYTSGCNDTSSDKLAIRGALKDFVNTKKKIENSIQEYI